MGKVTERGSLNTLLANELVLLGVATLAELVALLAELVVVADASCVVACCLLVTAVVVLLG